MRLAVMALIAVKRKHIVARGVVSQVKLPQLIAGLGSGMGIRQEARMDEALRAELLEMERVDRAVRADLVARGSCTGRATIPRWRPCTVTTTGASTPSSTRTAGRATRSS